MLVMASAVAPVLVSSTLWEGGGHFKLGTVAFCLHENVVRLAGISCTVPFVSISVAVLNFVASVIETALRSTLVFAGSVAGPLKADVPGLTVLGGFIIPHAGVQSDPF
jgi:hypothetical protein